MAIALLKTVWGDTSGYAFIPRRKGKVWDEGKAYKYPKDWDSITATILASAKDGWDTYWCPLLFSKPKRLKENALPMQHVLWADLDFVDPTSLGVLKPSIAWRSSDVRYQALWTLDKKQPIEQVERINKALTYKIGADKGGWDVTQVLRVPGSPNYKYTPVQRGKLLWSEPRTFDLTAIEKDVVITPVESKPLVEPINLGALLKDWTIPARAKDLIFADPKEVVVGDRSDRLWEIETLLIEAGLPILTIVNVIELCPWNKFKGRKNEHDQIYNEVLKADTHVKTKPATVAKVIEPTPQEIEHRESDWAIPFDRFASEQIDEPEWLVEGIWQKGTYGMIAGEPKTYKSIQATDLALSVASGKAFLNTFSVLSAGTVLYVQEENNKQTVQDRIFKIASSKGLLTTTKDGWALPSDLPLYFSNNFGINLTEQKSRELLENTIKELKPILVILDPLYMMMGTVDENSAQEVGDLLRWLSYLRNAYGIAIVICHHYNKGNGSTSSRGGQRVRGSSAFHAWVESAIYVKATTELYTVKIEREFRAFPTMAELTVKFELGKPGELLYVPQVLSSADSIELDNTKTELKMEEICTSLSENPHTEDELGDICKMSRPQIKRALETLMEAGKVVRVIGGGRGKKGTYILR